MRNLLRASLCVMATGGMLAACTTQQVDDTFGAACNSIPIADAGFQLYANTGKVSATVLANEQKAVAVAQAVCSGPAPTNVNTALAAVQRSLAAILKATSQAKAQAGA